METTGYVACKAETCLLDQMKEKEGNSLTKVQTVAWEQLFRKQSKRQWPVPRTGSGAVRAPSVGLEDSITRQEAVCTPQMQSPKGWLKADCSTVRKGVFYVRPCEQKCKVVITCAAFSCWKTVVSVKTASGLDLSTSDGTTLIQFNEIPEA